jgi:hypothetical protein
MLSRMKFEIEPLVAEMLDQLPEAVWASLSTTFFDPAIGGGQFVRAIEQRLRSAGHSDVNIRSRVFGFEESELHIRFAVNKYNLVGQYVRKPYEKFFELDDTMKFDVVIGNPPYQKEAEHGKKVNDNLWAPLTFKAWSLVKDYGYLAFITPDNWRTPTNDFRTEGKSILKEIIKPYRTVAINMNEAERHFSVGSTISYFVVNKVKDNSNITNVTSVWGQSTIDLNKLPTIPKDLSGLGLSIFSKVMSTPGKKWTFVQKQTKLNKSLNISEIQDKDHTVQLFDSFGGKPIKFCDKEGEDHSSPKAMISYVGKYSVLVDNGNITPAQHVHRQIIKSSEVVGARTQLESKLYKFIIEGNRANQYIEKHIPNMMLQLDMSKKWTDKAIYKHFGLTQEEIDYVEANVK